jgi:hypothetical protein
MQAKPMAQIIQRIFGALVGAARVALGRKSQFRSISNNRNRPDAQGNGHKGRKDKG